MMIKLIRWYVQAWHLVLLGLILAGLLTWIYLKEREVIRENIKLELAAYAMNSLPRLFEASTAGRRVGPPQTR